MTRPALIIGETLIDIIEQPEQITEFVGGSPANLAVGLARLGHPARLLTRIGRDARGERAAAHFADEGVALLPASWDEGPTSTAHARITADGSADYQFSIDWRLPEVSPEPVALMHAGSIALFLEPGGARVLDLLRNAPAEVLITLDPNARPALLGAHAQSLHRFEEAARLADLVKLSDEDTEWFYPGLAPEAAAEQVRALGPRLVVVTLGAQGAFAVCETGSVRVPAHAVEVVDTISAGDSFMASLVSSLLDLGLEGALATLPKVLDRAARAAAIAVSVAGPNPPRREQLDAD